MLVEVLVKEAIYFGVMKTLLCQNLALVLLYLHCSYFYCILLSLLSLFPSGLLSEKSRDLLSGGGASHQQWSHQQTTPNWDFIQGDFVLSWLSSNLLFFHFQSVFQHVPWFNGDFRGNFTVGKRRKVTSYSCSCFMAALKEYKHNSKIQIQERKSLLPETQYSAWQDSFRLC